MTRPGDAVPGAGLLWEGRPALGAKDTPGSLM